jgi:hypothetical protein
LSFASLSAASSINQLIVFTDILKKKLRFDFDFIGDYKISLQKVFSTIESFKKLNLEEIENKIEKHFNPSDSYIHLSYLSNDWQVIDPLVSRIREKSNEYMVGKDFRINKPSVILNENSHSELFTFENKWTLHFDKLYTNMFKPNDVSLYSNISDKNLMEAKELYKKIINSDNFFISGAFPNEKVQKEYFDYFEKIIQSIIFAFTSIEALLNLCFEVEEKYIWVLKRIKNKTEFTSLEIEKLFPFEEKIKLISKQILLIPDNESEAIIKTITDLKTIRDEIIHAKPSKSEERYSKFLHEDIFRIIESHKEFIKTIGSYIFKNKKYLLNVFPYNLDQNEFYPSMFSNEESIELFNKIHRPSSSNVPINTIRAEE